MEQIESKLFANGVSARANGSARLDDSADASPTSSSPPSLSGSIQFIFTFNGRILDSEQTPEEVGIDEGDEIIAVEMMDLTEGDGGSSEEWVSNPLGALTRYDNLWI